MIFTYFLLSFALLFNTKDSNDIYIENETSNIIQLTKNGNFEKGFIVENGDTIETNILKFNKQKKINPYLFCVTKDSAEVLKIYTARQIDGYAIGNEVYKSQSSCDNHFFIKLLANGKVCLFERYGIPSDRRFLYYIQLPKFTDYFIICPDGQNVNATIVPPDKYSPGIVNIDSKSIPEKFKLFVKNYLGDCVIVSNRVQSDFYTINDIPLIVEKYNECKNE
ncbi:MAG: hypothetical protein AB7S48_02460 [Bacteroidales bacterium]